MPGPCSRGGYLAGPLCKSLGEKDVWNSAGGGMKANREAVPHGFGRSGKKGVRRRFPPVCLRARESGAG